MIDLGRLRALRRARQLRHGARRRRRAALHAVGRLAAAGQAGAGDRRPRWSRRTAARLRLTDAGRLLADHAAPGARRGRRGRGRARRAPGHRHRPGHIAVVRHRLPGAAAVRAAPARRPTTRSWPPAWSSATRTRRSTRCVRGRVDLAVLDDWPEVALRPARRASTTSSWASTSPTWSCRPATGWRGGRPVRAGAGPRRAVDRRAAGRHLPRVAAAGAARASQPDFLVGEFETQMTLVAAGLGVAMSPGWPGRRCRTGCGWCRYGRRRPAGWWWPGARPRRPARGPAAAVDGAAPTRRRLSGGGQRLPRIRSASAELHVDRGAGSR